jgi:cardiolipin synthase
MLRRITVAVVLAVFASGCSFFSQSQRSHYTLAGRLVVEEPAFVRSLDNFGSVMIAGNAATLLEDGDGIFGAMLKDIAEARSFIHLETYIYKEDEAGRLFTDALTAAARRGVRVRLMVDAQGSRLGAMRDELESAGVICRDYRPAKQYNYLGRRTHRKLLVVDGTIGYTGGFCFDKRWLGRARTTDEWHESAVRVTGPVVAQMQSIFGEGWTFTTGEILAGETIYPKLSPTGSTLAQAMKASKGDSSSLPKMLYFMAIEASRVSIHIQNPYFLPDSQIRKALVDAAKRGVNVQVMVPGAQSDMPMVRMASRADFGELLMGGVKIFEYQPTMIHSKTLVVDGLFSTIGSINFDARSMSKNAELSVSFYDRGFAGEVEAMFQRDLARCREVTYEQWKNRGTSARMAEFFSRGFKELY